MNILKTTAAGLAISAASTAAFAEGLERQTFTSGFLFEKGNYFETAIGVVKPDFKVTIGGAVTSPNSIAQSFDVVSMAFKTDISEKFSVGMKFTTGANGVNLDYSKSGAGTTIPVANVKSKEIQLLGKYQLTDRVSVFGGFKHVTASGNLNLSGTGLTMGSGSDIGEIIGIAYEIPDIALRVAASYESALSIDLPTTVSGVGFPAGMTQAGIGDAIQLEFQSGVAENTLVFGKIRRGRWADNQVLVQAAASATNPTGQVSSFKDGNDITLGVARKVRDNLALSASIYYAPGDGVDSSALAPQAETKTLSLGARYTMENGSNLSLGVSHSRRGATTIAAPFNAYSFSGATVNSLGMKISKSF